MGLLDRLFGGGAQPLPPAVREREPAVEAVGQPVTGEGGWRTLSGGRISRAGVRVDETTALTQPATLQAVRIMSGVFAMVPLIYYMRNGEDRQRASQSSIYSLLHDRPNNYQSAFAYKELLFADLMLTGNAYSYVSRDLSGRPVALTRLKPRTVVIAESFDRRDGMTLFYDATLPDGTSERFSARDIWHIAGMTRDGIYGLNPLAYARDALGGAIATADYAARFWNNNARPSTVLRTEGNVKPEDRARMRDDWNRLYAGPDGEAVAVLDQGLKAEFLSVDNQKSQMVETRNFQLLELARIWGVPPHLLFDLSRATFSNIEQQSLEFLIYHLGPHFERFAGSATMQFAEAGHFFEHLTDAIVKADIKTRMEAYWLERQMGTVNADELRRRENRSPIGGVAGETYWRPANFVPADAPVPGPAAATVE